MITVTFIGGPLDGKKVSMSRVDYEESLRYMPILCTGVHGYDYYYKATAIPIVFALHHYEADCDRSNEKPQLWVGSGKRVNV